MSVSSGTGGRPATSTGAASSRISRSAGRRARGASSRRRGASEPERCGRAERASRRGRSWRSEAAPAPRDRPWPAGSRRSDWLRGFCSLRPREGPDPRVAAGEADALRALEPALPPRESSRPPRSGAALRFCWAAPRVRLEPELDPGEPRRESAPALSAPPELRRGSAPLLDPPAPRRGSEPPRSPLPLPRDAAPPAPRPALELPLRPRPVPAEPRRGVDITDDPLSRISNEK